MSRIDAAWQLARPGRGAGKLGGMTHRRTLMIGSAGCLAVMLALTPATRAGDDGAPERPPAGALTRGEAAAWEPPGHLRAASGFRVSVAAAPPLVEHPIMAGFDDRGRLYVGESAGQNLNEVELQGQTPNSIRRLEDTDGDGRFDRATVFAAGMTFPMGALWHRGALYVASPPYIWRLVDSDDDGVADVREPIVGRFGFIGNAADVHGCFLSPTGRIVWCDGRHGHELADAEGRVFSRGQAARIFSCRPDGSQIEVFCGGGMDNPVEVAFLPNGDMFGTMTFYNPDDARHDALVHYQYGGVYPRKHPVVAEFKRTGDFLPALVLYDTVAPSGLAHYDGDFWGAEFQDNLLSVHFNTHRVLRHVLRPSGASYVARDETLLESSDADFHPTDVLVDADGSVLVLDTGGWFHNGCPTSQVAKPEARGAIYRLTREGAPPVDDPRGLQLEWGQASVRELAARLADRRPAVRQRAIEALAAREDSAISALAPEGGFPNPALRPEDHPRATLGLQNAIWTLARIATPSAHNALRSALEDPEPAVRQAAAHALGELRDPWAGAGLAALLSDREAPVRRTAAAALGRTGHEPAVPALLALAGRADTDRFIEHAAIYALIEIASPGATLRGLDDVSPRVRRAALVALDQMDGGRLDREQVARLLDTSDPALEQAALAIIERRGWTPELLAAFDGWLAAPLAEERLATLRATLSALASEARVADWIGATLDRPTLDPAARRAIYQAIGELHQPALPDAWREAARRDLDAGPEPLRLAALGVLSGHAEGGVAAALTRLAGDEGENVPLRRAAALALAESGLALDDAAFGLLFDALSSDDVLERQAAASAQARAALRPPQRAALLPRLAEAGPLELAALLAVYREDGPSGLARRAVEAAALAPGRASLSAAALAEIAAGWPDELRAEASAKLLAQTTTDETAQRLETLAALTGDGDAALGKEVFQSAKAACSACHQVSGQGGRVGPDLTRIGEIRTPRDLLESLVLPSQTLARGYESISVATRQGHVYAGLIVRQTDEAVWLVAADRSQRRIPREAIESLEPSGVSIMPQGFDQALTREELAGLLAYLQSLK